MLKAHNVISDPGNKFVVIASLSGTKKSEVRVLNLNVSMRCGSTKSEKEIRFLKNGKTCSEELEMAFSNIKTLFHGVDEKTMYRLRTVMCRIFSDFILTRKA